MNTTCAAWWPSSCGWPSTTWSRRPTGPRGVARFDDSGPFDLALIDLNLPVYSGVEVCRRIKRSRPEQRIMICSAAIMDDHEEELKALGVGHFLTKPYHPESLLRHIALEMTPAGPLADRALAS